MSSSFFASLWTFSLVDFLFTGQASTVTDSELVTKVFLGSQRSVGPVLRPSWQVGVEILAGFCSKLLSPQRYLSLSRLLKSGDSA